MKNKFVRALIAVLLLVGLVLFLNTFFKKVIVRTPYRNAKMIRDEWMVLYKNRALFGVDLENFRYNIDKRGEKIEFYHRLENINFKEPMLSIYTLLSKVNVYLDDQLIYTYGEETFNKDQMLGSGTQWILLPKDCNGKLLKLVLTVGEKRNGYIIGTPIIMESKDSIADFMTHNFFYIIVGASIVVFGIALTLVSVVLSCYRRTYLQMLFGALFTVTLGLWFWSNTDTMVLVTDISTRAFVEYLSLYANTLSSMIFASTFTRENENKMMKTLIRISIIFNSILLGITIILHVSNILHIVRMLPIYHILILIHFTAIFFIGFHHVRVKNKRHYTMLLVGITIFLICMILTMAFYYIAKKFTLGIDYQSLFVVIGIISFMFGLVWSITSNVLSEISIYGKEKVRRVYELTDVQSGLGNRDALFEAMNKRRMAKELFAILCFDMDNFSKFNRNFGIKEGDAYLRGIADKLLDVGEGYTEVFKVGGDSFGVLLSTSNRIAVAAYIDDVEKTVGELSDFLYHYPLSWKIGVVYSDENELMSSEGMFVLAEERTEIEPLEEMPDE